MAECTSIEHELIEGSRILDEAGIPRASREASRIWAGLTGVAVGAVWLNRATAVTDDQVGRFRAAIQRRADGEPLAYVVGVAGFRYLDVLVDRRVLIPRPETEGLVDRVLRWGASRDEGGAVGVGWGTAADVGTGSGCIALSLASEGNFTRIIATDIAPGALEVAAANLAATAPGTPVQFRLGSLLEPLQCMTLDALVSNPPYLTPREHRALEIGVRDFEPVESLVGGKNGMMHTEVLVKDSARLLVPGGLLAIEVDSSRADEALSLAREAGWLDARIELDLFGNPRYLLAIKES
jgi:release factor glutamine methyltransferase